MVAADAAQTPTWMDDTPPSIRTGSGITGDSDDLVIGESGWFWEEAVLGGSISRVLAVEGDKGYTVDVGLPGNCA